MTPAAELSAWLSAFQQVEIHAAAKILSARAHAGPRLSALATTAKLQQERDMGWPFLRGAR